MPPPRTRLDPDGYYTRLGLEPTAGPTDIVKAYRQKARVLHPDVPDTGNANAFVAVKQAYDILSNQSRREAYDRAARKAALDSIIPEILGTPPDRRAAYGPPPSGPPPSGPPGAGPAAAAPVGTASAGGALFQRLRFADLPIMVWAGLGAFLCFCVYQAVSHLLAPSPAVRADIRPNAATIAPLSPSAQQAVLYGPRPVRLAGTPNFYVIPAGSPALLLRLDTEHNTFVSLGQLPPFSAVQAVRFIRQNGLLEVLVNDHGNGFVRADHLAQGNAVDAHRAYCSYNAGPMPADGELLERRGYGPGKLNLENRAVQPVVVKLRDETGAIMLSIFLGPGGHATLLGLPDGNYQPEFAIGELWSRACNTFAAGMRAQRMNIPLRLPDDTSLVVAPETADARSSEISDQTFDRN